jgi:hypothetical protein
MTEPRQECEAMGHVGLELDSTVAWRDLGLMCEACYAAYGDTRPFRAEVERLREPLDALEIATEAIAKAHDDELRAFLRGEVEANTWRPEKYAQAVLDAIREKGSK